MRSQAINKLLLSWLRFKVHCVLLAADFLGDYNTASALDVIFFVREIMETNVQLRSIILARLLESFKEIRSSRVCSSALWVIGEYCNTPADISAAMEVGLAY